MKYSHIQYVATYLVAIIASLCTLKIFYSILVYSIQTKGTLDFYIFIEHANLFINHGIIYLRDLSLYRPGAPIYKFPPLYGAILTQALSSGIQEDILYFYAWILQVICYITGILLCLHTNTDGIKSKNTPLIISIVFIFSLCNSFFIENTFRLQLEPYIFFLASMSIFLLTRDKPLGAGIFIGIAAMLKIYPALLILCSLFYLRNFRPIIIGFTASCTTALLISIWLLNVDENIFYVQHVLPLSLNEYTSESLENISIGHMLMPFFNSIIQLKIINLCTFIIAMAIWCFSTFFCVNSDITLQKNDTIAIDFSGLFMVMLIGMPNFWWNYQLLNLLPAIIAIKIIATNPRIYMLPLTLLTISFILQNIVKNYALLMDFFNMPITQLGDEFYVVLRGSIQISLFLAVLILQWQIHRKNNTEFRVVQ